MLRTSCARLACVATAAALLFLPRTLLAQQALVYCPVGIDATGCNAVVAAITADAARFPGGADAAYDGTGGTVDLATADLTTYAVFVVPSLADGPDAQPYSLIRNGTIAGRLQAAFVGRTAVWSGTPDVGTANRGAKDALIQNLAAWARADASGARGPGLVVLQDNSDDEAARYGWLAGVSGVSVAADPTLEIYSNAEVLTATGRAILTNSSGLQIGYTNMASAGLMSLSGLTADATGGRSGRPVLATAAGEGGGGGIATVHTDKEDYSPGETVIITGSGWEPGETVSMLLHEDPTLHDNRTFTAVADASGNIYNNSFLVDEHDLGVRFTLVATGQTSGRTAQTTFTDGTVKVRSQLSGITYTLTWTTFTTTTCTGSIDEGPNTETNVGASGGDIFNKGVGSTASIRLSAPALSDQGGTFTGWSSDAPGSFTIQDPPTNRVICVTGNFSGNREYTASYAAPVVNLSIDKSHSGTFIRGTDQDYILTVTNNGTAPTNAIVTVRDTLPTGLTFVSGIGTGWTSCTAAGQVVTCNRPAANVITPGQTAPAITLKVTVGAATAASITNRARVSGGGEAATSTVTCDAANNCDADPTTVVNANAAPQVDAGGPYTGAEGSAIALNTATATDVDGDALTYKWTYVVVGTVDVGTSCSFSNDAVLQPTFTCNDDGAFTVTLTVNDGNGHTVADNASVTVTNVKPTATAGGPYSGSEGVAIQLAGSGDDPGSNDDDPKLTYLWSVNTTGIDAGGTCAFDDATKKDAKVTCTDNSNAQPFTLTLVATDDDGANSTGSTATLTVTNADPVADAGGPYSGNEGTAISLNGTVTDVGSNDTHTWSWAYVAGPGVDAGATCSFSSATAEDPTITCTDDGTVELTFTATDDNGGTGTDKAQLTVQNVAPVAHAGGPYSGTEGVAIQLAGSATDAGGNDVISYKWTVDVTGIDAGGSCGFDDDTKKDAKVTCTDNSNAQPFKLKLVATDDDGASSTVSEATLTVANADPVADAGGPYTGNEGSAISLNGSVTDAGNNDTHVWSWVYVAGAGVDAGATCTFNNAAAEDPTITCTDDGEVQLTLTVKDDNGGQSTDQAILTVKNVAPVAKVGGPYSGDEGSAVQLAGSATDVGANDVITYKWVADVTGIDAGGACTFDDDTKKDAKVTCTDDGAFKVTLTATDDDGGSSSEQTTLTIANVAPVADAGGPYDGDEGAAVALNGTVTDAGANDTHTWSWEYVAGPGVDAGATCSFSNSTFEDPSITCTDDGTVELTFTTKDDNGGQSSDKTTLTLKNVAPVAEAAGPYSGSEGDAITLAGSATDAGTNDQISYKWTADVSGVPNGGTCSFDDATKKDAKITCNDNGTVTLTLEAKDDDGGIDTDVATLTVANVDPVAHAGGPYTGDEGSNIQLNGSVTDAGANDTHTWSWHYVAGPGVDAGATCTFSSPTAEDPTVKCTDDGTVELTLTVKDDDGGEGSDHATLTVKNVAPVAKAGGPYTGTEGAATQLAGSATDAGANDVISYKWTADVTGIDGGGTCSFDDDTKKDAKITCNDNGTASLTLTVKDDDDGTSSEQTTLTVANANPVASAGGPYSGSEGAPVSLSGAVSDAGSNDVVTHLWTYAPGAGVSPTATCSFSPNASALNATITCNDNGSFQVTLTATDDDGGTGTSSAAVTLTNVNPLLGAITAPVNPTDIATAVAVSAPFTDQGKNDTHTGSIDWGDGTTPAAITETPGSGSGTATGSHFYSDPGVYTIKMTVTDDDGGVSNQSIFQYVVIYDPSAGFVTGGGYIMSPVGAYVPDPTLVGKANFGFVAKYQKGKSIPDGDTEFQFHAASVNFKSTSYQWLVVQGTTKASYKGEGTINGTGAYGFMLSVVDGGSAGDKFRIKIWNKATSVVVYDNQMGGADDATASQGIASGSIVIHTNGGVASK